jgi:hypothetical protein
MRAGEFNLWVSKVPKKYDKWARKAIVLFRDFYHLLGFVTDPPEIKPP